MRLAYLLTELGLAGAERMVQATATALAQEHEVTVIALAARTRGGEDIGHALERAGVRVLSAGARGPFDLRALRRLRAILRASAPDLLHTHLWHARLAAALVADPQLPIVSTWHVVPEANSWRTRLAARAIRTDRATIGVSRAVTTWIREDLHAKNPRCLENGIDLIAARKLPSRAAARAQLKLGPDRRTVGFVGRLHPQKSVDLLLKAFAGFCAQREGLCLAIQGRGPEEPRLRRLAKELNISDAIHWIPFDPDPRPLYAAADLLVLPSRTEGFGLVALEAMAAGCPLIASRVPGFEELLEGSGTLISLRADGRDALLNPKERGGRRALESDLQARFCRAIEAKLSRPKDSNQLRKTEIRASHYSTDRMVAAHRALYYEIASGRL